MTQDLFADLEKLLADEAPPMLEDDTLTIKRLAERAGFGHSKAARVLEKWEREGKVTPIGFRRVPHGNKVKAWRLKQ